MRKLFLKTSKVGVLLTLFLIISNCNSENDSSEKNIFFGDVELRTQNEVNEFGANNYLRIVGKLVIDTSIQTDDTIVDLSPLNSIAIVDEQLLFYRLSNINSLTFNVSEVGALVFELENAISANFPNLIKTTTRGIQISNNLELTNFYFPNLSSVKSELQIINNPKLETLDGFMNLTSFAIDDENLNSISIQSNNLLSNFEGLINIDSQISYLNIETNNSLTSIYGLDNLQLKDIEISLNPSLNDYCAISEFLSIGESYDGNSYADGSANLYIDANLYNPNLQDFINGNCSL
tara:strand:+ start:32 stop:907 length:876 start_codon:yes stop_codon:yes gene_type:complete